MKLIRIKRFKAEFEMDLFKDIQCKIFFDENLEELSKAENIAGNKSIISHLLITDSRNDGNYEYQCYFALDGDIESSVDLFKDEIGWILKGWRKGSIIDWISPSNPECAWIFYKKTFDNVMKGQEFWETMKYSSEIECEIADGGVVSMKHFQDGSERLFLNGEYLGRVDTMKADKNKVIYCDCDIRNEGFPFFVCNTDEMEKYPDGKYKSFFESAKLFLESGVHIYHTGNLDAIAEGMVMAAEEFIRWMGVENKENYE